MISTHRSRMAAVVAVLAALFVACSLGDVDFANKACPCGTGYVCDSARDVCVLPSELHTDASVAVDGGSDAPVQEAGGDCTGDRCPCTVDRDCKARDLAHCSPGKICVECVAESDCRPGTYCNATNQCVLGCKGDSDCLISPSSPHCDTARHQCVQCRSKADCMNADECSPSGQCVSGCNVDAGQLCPGGRSCCGGLCIDTSKDLLNCGGCAIACNTTNGTPTCDASACTWVCANGFAHCGATNSGCETNLRTDPAHCGGCTTSCSALVANATGLTCNAGVCNFAACTPNHDDCDAVRTNGCECSCGTQKMERCCPGDTCNAPLTCLTGPKKCN